MAGEKAISETGMKPMGFFVTLRYRCPACKQNYFRTVEETRKTMICGCGAELRHHPVASIDLKIKFENTGGSGAAGTETSLPPGGGFLEGSP